jgi:hypothetical protein
MVEEDLSSEGSPKEKKVNSLYSDCSEDLTLSQAWASCQELAVLLSKGECIKQLQN